MDSNSKGPLARVLASRARFRCEGSERRLVFESVVSKLSDGFELSSYVADRAPLFYRELSKIMNDLKAGCFLSAFRDTLNRLPRAPSFQESHFGEILAGIFAEDINGLVILYSKLTLLTAENANAYKMDLLLCNPKVAPVEFIFGEVKTSYKCAGDGLPAGHDKVCFANLFDSFNKYDTGDLEFDLTAARDRIDSLNHPDAENIRAALLPHRRRSIKYAGFAIIDVSTRDDKETELLATRRNSREFTVDLICVESLKEVAKATYEKLGKA